MSGDGKKRRDYMKEEEKSKKKMECKGIEGNKGMGKRVKERVRYKRAYKEGKDMSGNEKKAKELYDGGRKRAKENGV